MQRIVIFHYHLNPGGVTRIIESQIASLKANPEPPEIKVICGDGIATPVIKKHNIQLSVYPELNYLTDTSGLPNKLDRIRSIFHHELRPGDILHAHNLNLGKNPLVTMAIAEFIEQGQAVINHAHDFSEDRRTNQEFLEEIINGEFELNPGNVMYPDKGNLVYVVLNSSDYWRLITYGIDNKNIELLPNPVAFEEKAQRSSENRQQIIHLLRLDPHKPIVTYPVRVIRRKNIAEFILLSILLTDKANWVVTQPPKNPVEIEHYEQWTAFCHEYNLPIVFEAGNKVDFLKLMSATDFCITTSLQEGFGMAFIEPWLMDIPVIGRDIDMVTRDIKSKGIEFPLLYEDIKIPLNEKLVSFAQLGLDEQQRLLKVLLQDKKNTQIILELNPFIANLLTPVPAGLIERNKDVIRTQFSIENYGRTLHGLYKRLVEKPEKA